MSNYLFNGMYPWSKEKPDLNLPTHEEPDKPTRKEVSIMIEDALKPYEKTESVDTKLDSYYTKEESDTTMSEYTKTVDIDKKNEEQDRTIEDKANIRDLEEHINKRADYWDLGHVKAVDRVPPEAFPNPVAIDGEGYLWSQGGGEGGGDISREEYERDKQYMENKVNDFYDTLVQNISLKANESEFSDHVHTVAENGVLGHIKVAPKTEEQTAKVGIDDFGYLYYKEGGEGGELPIKSPHVYFFNEDNYSVSEFQYVVNTLVDRYGGGTIIFDAGHYVLDKPIEFSGSVNVYGMGMKETVFYRDDSDTTFARYPVTRCNLNKGGDGLWTDEIGAMFIIKKTARCCRFSNFGMNGNVFYQSTNGFDVLPKHPEWFTRNVTTQVGIYFEATSMKEVSDHAKDTPQSYLYDFDYEKPTENICANKHIQVDHCLFQGFECGMVVDNYNFAVHISHNTFMLNGCPMLSSGTDNMYDNNDFLMSRWKGWVCTEGNTKIVNSKLYYLCMHGGDTSLPASELDNSTTADYLWRMFQNPNWNDCYAFDFGGNRCNICNMEIQDCFAVPMRINGTQGCNTISNLEIDDNGYKGNGSGSTEQWTACIKMNSPSNNINMAIGNYHGKSRIWFAPIQFYSLSRAFGNIVNVTFDCEYESAKDRLRTKSVVKPYVMAPDGDQASPVYAYTPYLDMWG